MYIRDHSIKKHLNFYKSQTDHLFGINICTAYVFISFLHDDYVPLVMFDDVPMIGGKWQISKIMRCEWQQMSQSLFFFSSSTQSLHDASLARLPTLIWRLTNNIDSDQINMNCSFGFFSVIFQGEHNSNSSFMLVYIFIIIVFFQSNLFLIFMPLST